MEKQPEGKAVAEPADSGGEGGQPQVAGAEAAGSEDRKTLLLRLRAQTNNNFWNINQYLMQMKKKLQNKSCKKSKLRLKLETWKNEIEESKIAFEMKSLALERMQLSSALKRNLEKTDTKTSLLLDNMKQILKLNKLIMKSQQESWDLEEKLLDVRKKRLQLKQASESKLLEIQTEKNKQKDNLDSVENSDKIKTIQQNLKLEIQITTVIQHVFQNLILGSKTNWAEDSTFKDTVLQLEKNLFMI